MALQRVLFLFVTSCVLFLKCDEIRNDDSSDKIVLAVLEHLNSKPNNVYGYKNGTITNAQQKADIIELTLEVDAKCTNNIPDVPYSERIFTCTGFVQKVEEKYTIPSDLVCKPVIPVSSENIETFTPNENLSEKVELSHEAVSSESGEKFVAIRNTTAPCLNCLITLNPNVEGVQNLLDTALRHVESERTQRFSIVRIINLQQQVTLGVNYYLLVEMASTLCKKDDDSSQSCSIDVTAPALYCNIQYLQKPWISPVKNIVQNNCTVSQEFAGVDKNDLNDIEQQIIKKPDVVRNEMEPSRLADLESQIIFDNVETVNQDQVAPISNAISQKNVPQVELLPAIVPIHEPLVVEELNPVIYQRRPNEGYFYDLFEAPANQYEHIQPTNEYIEPVQQWPSQPNDFIEEPKQFLSPPPEEFPEPITIKNTSVPLNFNEFQSDEPVETTTTVEEETTILPSSEKPIKTITVSSESKESTESSEELVKNRVKRKDTNKQSSESEESTEKSNLMTKQSAESGPSSEEVGKNRIKRSDSSSSSSSSSSEEDDKTTKKEKATKIKAKDDNNDDNNNNDKDSDSSSSSSEDEENNEIRPKRSIGQLEKITQDEKPIVKDLADFAAASLDKIDDDKYKRVILQILGAKKLHLDGIYYSLILRLGISHCLEDAYITDECRNNLFTNLTKICKVQVHVEDDLSNPKVVKSQCQNIKKDEYDRNRTNYSRYKRFLIEHRRNKRQIPGGLKPIATNDETIVKFTQQTLPHLDSHFKSDKKHKVIEIISAQSQVVAGTKYIIDAKISLSDCSLNDGKTSDQCNILQDSSPKTCHIEVWDRPWLSITKYTVKCDNAVLKFEGNSRSKRQLLGGLNPIDVNDPRVLFFTKKTLPQLDNYFRSDNKHKIIEITSAQSQVVAGLKFLIDAKVSLSDCSLNDATNPDECNILQNSNPKLCSITVWDRPWLSNTQYTIKCDNNNIFKFEDNEQRPRFKRQIPGGFTPQDKNDPQILTFTKNSLPHLDNYFKSDNKHKIIEIISAKSQIVAGTKYVIDAKISLSDCSLNDANNPDNCNSLTGSHPKICQITVWDRPWLHSTQYTVKCDDNKILKFEDNEKRNKRNIDLPNDRSMVLTKQLLPHLDEYYKTNKKHKIIKILSAQNDLQDNSMKIIAEFALSDCSLNETKPTEECKTLLGTEKIQCYFDISCSHLCQFYTKYKVHCNKDNITFGHLKQDPRMFRYINTAIEYYNIFTKIDNKFIFKKLENAFFYKNSKSIWVLTYQMGLSDCNKVSQNQFCELLDKDNALTCRLTVNLQSNTSEFKCFDDPSMIYNVLPDIVNSPLNLNLLNDFKEFLTSYNKSYKTDIEFIYRMKIFHQNLKKIAVLNKFEQGTAVYGVTKYADMSVEEFSRSHGLRPDLRSSNELPFLQAEIPDIDLPTEFDWRSKGAVTEVKNQGLCGSCWAFSTTGNVEGQNFIQHGKLLEFSEQELVDCDSLDQGCEGGLMDNAYRSIEKIGGLETEQDYPYDGDDEKCHFNKTKVKVQLSGAVNISHDETEMAKWLTKNGPIAIAINANAMQFYFGGISHPYKFLCNPNSLDHGVLIVGYGVQKYPLFNKTLPFWIVKNSWSSYWGEQGYYRVYRGDGTCGLNQTPSSAIVQ